MSPKWELVINILNKKRNNRKLWNIDLSNSVLKKAHLEEAKLENANLMKADLSGANLKGANLQDADLRGATLIGTKFDEETIVDEKWRIIADIVTKSETHRDLSHKILLDTNLQEAYLVSANLSATQLTGSILINANLEKGSLKFRKFRQQDFKAKKTKRIPKRKRKSIRINYLVQ